MSDDLAREERIQQALRTGRWVACALLLGLIVFYTVILCLLTAGRPGQWPRITLPFPLPVLSLALALVMVAVSFLVKRALLSSIRRLAGEKPLAFGSLLMGFRVATVTALGLCEAGGFVIAIGVLVAGPGELAWLATGLLPLLGIVAHFPTREAADRLLFESGAE